GGGGVGQQGHLAGVLHRGGHVTLVLAAVAGDAAGADLAPVGDELAQQRGVLVIDQLRAALLLRLAEHADLLLRFANGWLGHDESPGVSRKSTGIEGNGVLERGLVGETAPAAGGGSRTPRVIGRRACRGPTEAAAARAAADLVHLRGGIAQRRPDLINFELEDRALLAFLGLERALLEAPLHYHAGAAGQR